MKSMQIVIKFVNPVKQEKVLHNLRNVKKIVPFFRSYIPEVDNHEFSLLDDKQEKICSCKLLFPEKGSAFVFSGFRGSHRRELERMLTQNLIEEIGEKAFVKTFIGEKEVEIYYDLDNFFVKNQGRIFKLGLDGERLIEVEGYHVPREMRES